MNFFLFLNQSFYFKCVNSQFYSNQYQISKYKIMISYTLKEVSSHNKKQSLWIVLDKKVYDVTSFINDHPGGQKALLSLNAKDGIYKFNKVNHSDSAKKKRDSLYIGEFKDQSKVNLGTVLTMGILALGIGTGIYFGIYKNSKISQKP